METDIKLHTSYVTKKNLDILKSHEILPVLIIRDIENNDLIKNYSNSLIHFKDLSPSKNIERIKYTNFPEFEKLFKEELLRIDLNSLIKRLEYLLQVSESKRIALLGYGVDRDKCHRSIVSRFLNTSNLFKNKITELIL